MQKHELFDFEALKRQVMGDVEFLSEQLEFFRGYYPNQLHQIQSAIARRDAKQVREWAHQLSGSLSSLRATTSCETAKSIEACGRENRMEDAANLSVDLEKQLVELCDALENAIREF